MQELEKQRDAYEARGAHPGLIKAVEKLKQLIPPLRLGGDGYRRWCLVALA